MVGVDKFLFWVGDEGKQEGEEALVTGIDRESGGSVLMKMVWNNYYGIVSRIRIETWKAMPGHQKARLGSFLQGLLAI